MRKFSFRKVTSLFLSAVMICTFTLGVGATGTDGGS
jgi:hypothetical protein